MTIQTKSFVYSLYLISLAMILSTERRVIRKKLNAFTALFICLFVPGSKVKKIIFSVYLLSRWFSRNLGLGWDQRSKKHFLDFLDSCLMSKHEDLRWVQKSKNIGFFGFQRSKMHYIRPNTTPKTCGRIRLKNPENWLIRFIRIQSWASLMFLCAPRSKNQV